MNSMQPGEIVERLASWLRPLGVTGVTLAKNWNGERLLVRLEREVWIDLDELWRVDMGSIANRVLHRLVDEARVFRAPSPLPPFRIRTRSPKRLQAARRDSP